MISQFKSYMFKATIFWIIIGVIGVRLYSTTKLGEATSIIGDTKATTQTCNAADYSSLTPSPTYATPNQTVLEAYRNSKISNNLVKNTAFSDLGETGSPQNYTGNISSDNTKKTVEVDDSGDKYLRVNQISNDNLSDGSWIPEFFDITASPYYFSFEYKSTVTSTVFVELQTADNKISYNAIHTLTPNDSWHSVEGHFENYANKYKSARVLVAVTSAGTLDFRKLNIQQLRLHKLNEPMASVTFDDGWERVYTEALPLFKQYNIPTTQFINPKIAEEKNINYMTFDQISKLAKKGHEIASHSLTHCPQTVLTSTELENDAKQSKKILKDRGFDQPGGFAYPFGEYNQSTQQAERNLYSYIRTSDVGYNDYYYDISNLRVQNIHQDTTVQEISDWLTYAKNHNLWIIFVYHDLNNDGKYAVRKADFEDHLKAIKSSNIKVLTIKDALEKINN